MVLAKQALRLLSAEMGHTAQALFLRKVMASTFRYVSHVSYSVYMYSNEYFSWILLFYHLHSPTRVTIFLSNRLPRLRRSRRWTLLQPSQRRNSENGLPSNMMRVARSSTITIHWIRKASRSVMNSSVLRTRRSDWYGRHAPPILLPMIFRNPLLLCTRFSR